MSEANAVTLPRTVRVLHQCTPGHLKARPPRAGGTPVRTIGFLALITLVLAVTTGLTACGGGDSATPEEELCSALDDFRASVDAVNDLVNNRFSPLDDVKAAFTNMINSAADVADAAKDVTSADVSELQAAAESLPESLQTALADPDPPPGNLYQEIKPGYSTIVEASQQAIDDLDCDTSS